MAARAYLLPAQLQMLRVRATIISARLNISVIRIIYIMEFFDMSLLRADWLLAERDLDACLHGPLDMNLFYWFKHCTMISVWI